MTAAMPGDRVPQNSANSIHRSASGTHRRLLTDLQAVYQKIIHKSGNSFPFRARDNGRCVQLSQPSSRRSGRYDSSRVYTSDSALFNPRVESASQSIQEIVITPLSTPVTVDRVSMDRDSAASHSCNRRNSTPATVSTQGLSENHDIPIRPDCIKPRVSRVQTRCKSSTGYSSSEYSEQSIRYVAEQVALEQARQLKQKSNPQQHRIDRKYFVCGSRYPVHVEEFEEAHRSVVSENCNSKATLYLNRGGVGGGRIKSPPKRQLNGRKPQIFTLSHRHRLVGSRIGSAHRDTNTTGNITKDAAQTAAVCIPHAAAVSTLTTHDDSMDKCQVSSASELM